MDRIRLSILLAFLALLALGLTLVVSADAPRRSPAADERDGTSEQGPPKVLDAGSREEAALVMGDADAASRSVDEVEQAAIGESLQLLSGTPRNKPGPDQDVARVAATPASEAERRMFLATILMPHAEKGGAALAPDIKRHYEKSLKSSLTSEERQQSSVLIDVIVGLDVAYRVQLNQDLAHYIANAPDLGRPQGEREHGSSGVKGSLSHGVQPEWSRFWGGAKSVAVNYWLPFSDYPRLGEARDALERARKQLRPYQR